MSFGAHYNITQSNENLRLCSSRLFLSPSCPLCNSNVWHRRGTTESRGFHMPSSREMEILSLIGSFWTTSCTWHPAMSKLWKGSGLEAEGRKSPTAANPVVLRRQGIVSQPIERENALHHLATCNVPILHVSIYCSAFPCHFKQPKIHRNDPAEARCSAGVTWWRNTFWVRVKTSLTNTF